MIKRFALAAALAVALASPAAAAVVSALVTVSGTPGSGLTTWTFSGTSTASGAIRVDDNDADVGLGWVVGAPFFAGTDTNIDFLATSATLTAGGVVYDIEGVGAQDTNPTTVFGIAIERAGSGAANFTFADDTDLTFAGSATAAIDISFFAPGDTLATVWHNRGQLANGGLEATFRVSPTPVPLPATLPALAGAFALLVAARRRRG